MRLRFVICIVATTLLSCSDRKPTPNATSQPSPNAAILPAPLSSASDLATATPAHSAGMIGIAADSAGRLIIREPEPPPPEPASPERALPADALTSKDGAGYTLEGAFRWADLPAPAQAPEVVAAALRDAASKTELKIAVDLGSIGRMRLSFESPAFPLPAHAEIRAHTSYYGHVLVWPNGSAYRVLAPGSLRAMFAERRADVSPLLRATVTPGESGSLLEHKTQKTNIETSLGTLSLEQTTVPGSGGGGPLFCRLLVELIGAEPTTEACRADRIPLAARYKWAAGGTISFSATTLSDRKDIPLGYLDVPPAGATFTPGELPPPSSGVFLDREDLARFRNRVVRVGAPSPHAPGEGIIGKNDTTLLEYLLIDGVPVAWVRPNTQQYVIGPVAGRYSIGWRDFFGTKITRPSIVELPALVHVGHEPGDGGASP